MGMMKPPAAGRNVSAFNCGASALRHLNDEDSMLVPSGKRTKNDDAK